MTPLVPWLFYLEQGRQEILAGHPDRALVYLSRAYEEGASSPSLPFLLELAIGGLELRSTPLTGHTGTVSCAVFSADSRRVLTTAADHSARIWDAVTGATKRLTGHRDEVAAYVQKTVPLRLEKGRLVKVER